MLKSIILLTAFWGFILQDNVKATPEGMEDLQAGAVMAFAAVKGAIDNGAAAKDKKEFEFFGAKIKNDMAVGFGDAMRDKRSSSDSSSDESDRRKRFSSFEEPIEDTSKFSDDKSKFPDTKRAKRSNSDESDSSSLSLSISSSSSSSSSSESEDTERRKRSTSFEIPTNDIRNIYKKIKRFIGNESSTISSKSG